MNKTIQKSLEIEFICLEIGGHTLVEQKWIVQGSLKFIIMFWEILWSIWEVKFQVQWEKLLASTIGLRVGVAFNEFFSL